MRVRARPPKAAGTPLQKHANRRVDRDLFVGVSPPGACPEVYTAAQMLRRMTLYADSYIITAY